MVFFILKKGFRIRWHSVECSKWVECFFQSTTIGRDSFKKLKELMKTSIPTFNTFWWKSLTKRARNWSTKSFSFLPDEIDRFDSLKIFLSGIETILGFGISIGRLNRFVSSKAAKQRPNKPQTKVQRRIKRKIFRFSTMFGPRNSTMKTIRNSKPMKEFNEFSIHQNSWPKFNRKWLDTQRQHGSFFIDVESSFFF